MSLLRDDRYEPYDGPQEDELAALAERERAERLAAASSEDERRNE